MKKLLLILVMLFTFSLVACDNETVAVTTENVNAIYQDDLNAVEDELQAQIDELLLQIEAIQSRIDNIVVTEGLNGQKAYYENQMYELTERVSLLNSQIGGLYFDSTLAPDYTYDENGDYITAEQLADMLKDKYFGDLEYRTNGLDAYMLDKLYIYYELTNATNIDPGDIIARMILMTQELSNYNHYMMSCPFYELDLLVEKDGLGLEYNIKIPLTVMLNSYFSIEAGSLLSGGYEMYLTVNVGDGVNIYSKTEVYSYYDNYVLLDTFSGYVLNYTE